MTNDANILPRFPSVLRATTAAPTATDTLGAGVRGYAGVVSTVSCVTILALAGHVWLNLSGITILRVLAGLYVLGIAPGYLVQRLVVRSGGRTPFEIATSSLLLGVLLTPFAWYLANAGGMPMLFWMLVGIGGVAAPIVWRRSRHSLTKSLERIELSETLSLWGGVALTLMWGMVATLATPVHTSEGIVSRIGMDHQFHLGWMAEFARGIPAAMGPFMAPDHRWAYHCLPDLWCDLLRRISGTDIDTAYFRVALPLRYVLISLACYLGLHRRFGRIGAGLSALAMFGWLGASHVRSFMPCPPLTNWLATYFDWNPPSGPALVAIFLTLYFVSLARGRGTRGNLVIASGLAGLLFWNKANLALVVVPAVLLFVGVRLLLRRDVRGLALSAAVFLGIVAAFYLSVRSADLRSVLVFAPFRFMHYLWWEGSECLAGLKPAMLAGASADAVRTLRYGVDCLPSVLRPPAIFAICMTYLFHVGIVVGVLAVWRRGFGRRQGRLGDVDRLMLLILGFTLIGFVLLPVQRGFTFNLGLHNFAVVHALLLALAGPVLASLIASAWRSGRKVFIGTIVAVVCVVGVNAYAMTAGGGTRQSDATHVISPDTYACYGWIKRHTPKDAIILHPGYSHGSLAACVLTQRRQVLDCAPWWSCQWPRVVLPRIEACMAFYRGMEPDAARAWLEEREVDYVITKRGFPGRAAYAPFLREEFTHGDQAVSRFMGGGTNE